MGGQLSETRSNRSSLDLKTFVKEMEGRKMRIGLELVDESGAVLCDGMVLFLLANGTRL